MFARVAFFLMSICSTMHLNFYEVQQRNNQLDHHCFYYQMNNKMVDYHVSMKPIYQFIAYCIRSFPDHFVNATENVSAISFEELDRMNISSDQLLSWSSSIDDAELYQLYLNDHQINKTFYNCTWPWFGLYCQYRFDFDDEFSFDEIIYQIFHSRNTYGLDLYQFTNLSCYVHIDCQREETLFCLDWREICDGKAYLHHLNMYIG